ncbi:Nucleoside-diphosphate-sugar epimerase [Friedmanniella luteola]|uniref:Nucleoside-diphosphate-sugar epimerase n=1 Tax=Friedmanniella luteola TaxID=546871 RepID=A0A1H1ST27_9ACTN|nr:NAD-dependent epimerase/dehydratase family protein [Friedmanniella luteola]SDS51085.1 Nucleoside-diphosphate-sugar epimerase [Friedmanniella luteola]
MASTALVIGGSGQIGLAVADALRAAGWEVVSASRGSRPPVEGRAGDGVVLDREDTAALRRTAQGHDLVVDTVAFTPAHARQLLTLDVGALVVISTAAVYEGANGTYLDVVTDPDSYPDYPVPITEDWPTVDNAEQTYSPLKAAMERELLGGSLPVSLLRAGAVHGPGSAALREWYYIKRALDRQERVTLPWGGEGRFHPASTANLAALALACAEAPGHRVLNAVDEECPTDAEIGRAVFELLGHEAEITTVAGPPRDDAPASPWSTPKPFVLSMARARDDVGYVAPLTWRAALEKDVDWAVRAVRRAEDDGGSWHDVFPDLRAWGADDWFSYRAEEVGPRS